MLALVVLFFVQAASLQSGSALILGATQRDLTGDGEPEILRVIGIGPIDNLDATFTIESADATIYEWKLAPLTRTVGFDGSRQTLTEEQHRARLAQFGPWFFADEKFERPYEFVANLEKTARLHVAKIPEVIARDKPPSKTRTGNQIWEEIRDSTSTIFWFSPGGDAIVVIGWSSQAGRFYRLVDCC